MRESLEAYRNRAELQEQKIQHPTTHTRKLNVRDRLILIAQIEEFVAVLKLQDSSDQ
jgi:hypothetical protein